MVYCSYCLLGLSPSLSPSRTHIHSHTHTHTQRLPDHFHTNGIVLYSFHNYSECVMLYYIGLSANLHSEGLCFDILGMDTVYLVERNTTSFFGILSLSPSLSLSLSLPLTNTHTHTHIQTHTHTQLTHSQRMAGTHFYFLLTNHCVCHIFFCSGFLHDIVRRFDCKPAG